jgi:hypothetical protein
MIAHRMRRKIRHLALATTATSAFTVIAGTLLTPVPPLKDTFSPQTLADPDSQFIEINGLSVHVKTAGQGAPVFILLHGFAASLYTWQAVMDPLSKLSKVIAYDRTGFGLSARPLTWREQNPYRSESGVAVVHIFRFNGDRVVELWDVGQTIPADSPNRDGAF